MIVLNYHDPRPLYAQLKECLRREILSGVLQAGEQLPSVRELAASLAINPNTIRRAGSVPGAACVVQTVSVSSDRLSSAGISSSVEHSAS